MKIIVAGSRKITDKEKVFRIISDGIAEIGNPLVNDIEIISGGALGVDTIAEEYAKIQHLEFHKFPAFWEKHGKQAGFYRNCAMSDYVGNEGALVAIWDGKSKGTKMMIDIAKKKGLKVFVYENNNKRK